MRHPGSIERRDPAYGMLRLGSLLVRSLRRSLNGEIEVRDGNRRHAVRLSGGIISAVYLDGKKSPAKSNAARRLERQVEHFFFLRYGIA